MIRLSLSTDVKGHPHNATLIASILRRTKAAVHVRCWCRGFSPLSFETGRLKVEFISATEEVTGRYPSHVSTAVFDRLRVIRDSTDWDRCLVMDHDMICLSDLAEYFEEDFEGNLLMARLFGPGNTVKLQMKARGGLPASQAFAEDYPFFFMGPMMNLELMRKEGTWEHLLEAHAAIGEEEQISLTVATGGRTKDIAAKWNQVPQWDFPKNTGHPSGLGDPDRLEGIIHWTGPMKPWHSNPKIWRSDIWEAEKSTWFHLRNGLWNKPIAIEVEPDDDREISALARRGWKVKVYPSGLRSKIHGLAENVHPRYPDAEHYDIPLTSYDGYPEATVNRVRLGRWTDPIAFLKTLENLPKHLVLQGPLTGNVLNQIYLLGYDREFRLLAKDWPLGGPLPGALDFRYIHSIASLGIDEEIYLGFGLGTPPLPELIGNLQEPLVDQSIKIGVCLIAPESGLDLIDPLIQSIQWNFLPQYEVTVFIFSNGVYRVGEGIQFVKFDAQKYSIISLNRYQILRDHEDCFLGTDFLFCLDVDMRVVATVGSEILHDLVAALHPGVHDKPRPSFPYEACPDSCAFVGPEEGVQYYTGAFQGGRSEVFLSACRIIAERIERDKARGFIAKWEDESHWNRYLIDHPPSMVLQPSYGGCIRGKTDDAKILMISKSARTIERLEQFNRGRIRSINLGQSLKTLTIELRGGMGNQMFQYAHALALCERFGLSLKIAFEDHGRPFALGAFGLEISPPSLEPVERIHYDGSYHEGMEWPTAELIMGTHAEHLRLSGYFQNELFFLPVANKIRMQFCIAGQKPAVEEANGTPVCIHVRRGDFIGNDLHAICSIDYYLLSISLIKKLAPDARFLLFSDDPEWCSKQFSRIANLTVVKEPDPFSAISMMAACEAFILSNSTFGWWAAWIADAALVIAPSKFLKSRSWNICPDRWISIPAQGVTSFKKTAVVHEVR